MDESGFEHETICPDGYAPSGSPCIDSYNWQAKFLRQGWMENNLNKLFHGMGCTNVILD